MLAPPHSPVPAINIEFCNEQVVVKEPSSPFDNISFGLVEKDVDAYRPIHLCPPPVRSPKERVVTQGAPRSKGLDAARFEALKNQAKNASSNTAKLGLRKEVAMRVHQSKQIERRNLFLSKIEALPSPTAASLPVTPPESPAVFHFSLPSPGLVSPLALFETLDVENSARSIRVEQVDFRAKARKEAEALAALTGYKNQSLQMHGLAHESTRSGSTKQSLPSLEQISQRLGGNITVTRAASPGSRLPAFLQRAASPPKEEAKTTPVAPTLTPTPVSTATPTAAAATYVAPIPKYSFTPTTIHGPIARPASSKGQHKQARPPVPTSVTLAGPHIASTRPPTPLTAEALNALAYRAERGTVMMERLQRRFSAPARMSAQHQQNNQRSLARPVGGF